MISTTTTVTTAAPAAADATALLLIVFKYKMFKSYWTLRPVFPKAKFLATIEAGLFTGRIPLVA